MIDLLILAEATAEAGVPPWLQAGGFATLLSLVCWWVYHTTSVAIPKIHQEQRDHVEKITTDHRETITTIVQEFRDENKEHRVACAQEKQMLWDQLQVRRQPHGS